MRVNLLAAATLWIGSLTSMARAAPVQEELGGPASGQIIVSLPNALSSSTGQLVVEPQVQIGTSEGPASQEMQMRWIQTRPSAQLSEAAPMVLPESLPPIAPTFGTYPPSVIPNESATPPVFEAPPIFDSVLQEMPRLSFSQVDPCGEAGLGRQRLAFSMFDIDSAQPFNNFRSRFVFARGMQLPDRAEYFWGRTVDRTGPPLGEDAVDYQDLRLRMEMGSKKFSTSFEVPFRAVDPERNGNHAGLGDMQLIVKTVLLDGKEWLLTQYFGTHFATGSSKMGLGTGHVGLEPGLLFRNEWDELTWIHGELKFWFPLGADPEHHGQVLKFATGINRVWMETDRSALLPSIELTNFTVLNGLARNSAGTLRRIDGDCIFYFTPGIRYAVDQNGDFGLFEIGSALSFPVSDQRFADTSMTIDLRWSY